MRPPSSPNVRAFAATCVLALGVGSAFWVPAFAASRGYFPAPLDDVYIHFDFARSLAQGHPFEWVPGNGYSSGETAPLYALVLAVGWLAGFRERGIGLFAAIVAVLAVASFLRSLQRLMRPCPAVVAWLVPVFALSVGLIDWTLFSGMEVAFFAAILGKSLEALRRCRARIDERGGLTREAAQWRLGLWGAALVLVRPEAGALVAIFSVVAARGAGRRSGILAMARAGLPGGVATSMVLGANRLLTGETQSAGALLKLIASNPYLTEEARARVYVENLVTFALKGVREELGWPGLGLLALAAVALFSRERRSVAAACLASAFAWVLVVTLNSNAPFHNFRYYVPALMLVMVSAGSGAAALANGLRRAHGAAIVSVLVACGAVLFGARFRTQTTHFRRSTANIRDQQIEIGKRLRARLAKGERVLLGDAGAIPFVSHRPAIDALGLGGYRGIPFARAALHGEAATVELIERLAPAQRPAYLALYPNWFAVITSRFGVEVDRVTLTDNVICGGPSKVIYRAEWGALDVPHSAPEDVLDEIDIADVVSERAHSYASPAPYGGWTTLEILTDSDGARRFDGGRIIPRGTSESFVLGPNTPRDAPLTIKIRIDDGASGLRLHHASGTLDLVLTPKTPGTWREATGTFRGSAGDVVRLEAASGDYRNYHVWIHRGAT